MAELRGRGEAVGLGLCLSAGKPSTLVKPTSFIALVLWLILPDFLAVRKIPIKERAYLSGDSADASTLDDTETRPEDSSVTSYFEKIREHLLTDRALHDLVRPAFTDAVEASHNLIIKQAAKAFVSFVRAYSKHEASYIFRVKDLDLVGVAKSFGLLRLPKMPEMKEVNREGWQDAAVDVSPY